MIMSGRSGVLFARCCTPDNLYAKLNLNKSSYGVKIYKLIRNKNNVCAYGVVVDIRLTTYRHGGERWLSGRLAFLLRWVLLVRIPYDPLNLGIYKKLYKRYLFIL